MATVFGGRLVPGCARSVLSCTHNTQNFNLHDQLFDQTTATCLAVALKTISIATARGTAKHVTNFLFVSFDLTVASRHRSKI